MNLSYNEFQRWLVFRVGITSLQKYVDKRMSLLDVIKQLDDGLVYLVDVLYMNGKNMVFHKKSQNGGVYFFQKKNMT